MLEYRPGHLHDYVALIKASHMEGVNRIANLVARRDIFRVMTDEDKAMARAHEGYGRGEDPNFDLVLSNWGYKEPEARSSK